MNELFTPLMFAGYLMACLKNWFALKISLARSPTHSLSHVMAFVTLGLCQSQAITRCSPLILDRSMSQNKPRFLITYLVRGIEVLATEDRDNGIVELVKNGHMWRYFE